MTEQELREKELRAMIDGSSLPGHMKGALERYLFDGIPTGGCLQKMLSDQFLRAWPYADIEYRQAVPELIRVLTDQKMPYAAVGSEERYHKWIAHHGLLGAQDG